MSALRKLFALACAAAACGSMPVAAQVQSASAGEIGAAVATCLKATQAGAVDEQAVRADGWQKAEMSRNGQPVGGNDQLYARRDSHALLMVPQGPNAPKLCAVLARTAAPAPFAAVADGITAALQAQPTKPSEQEYRWLHGRQAVDLAARGTPEAPALQIAVIALPQGPQ